MLQKEIIANPDPTNPLQHMDSYSGAAHAEIGYIEGERVIKINFGFMYRFNTNG